MAVELNGKRLELLRAADRRLYQAKNAGRGRVDAEDT
jgi:PleD family two-component response regulator